jgi:signal transduction histidine kinase
MDKVSSGKTRFGALLDAIDEERSRIGHRLHDGVIQNLAVISMRLAELENACPTPEARQVIQDCTSLADESIRDMRALCYRLHPLPVPGLGLDAGVRALAEFAAADGVTIHTEMDSLDAPSVCGAEVFAVICDCIRGLVGIGLRDVHLRLSGGGERAITVRVSSNHDTGIEPGETLFWWIIQERVGRLGGNAKISAVKGFLHVELTIPEQDETWTAAH